MEKKKTQDAGAFEILRLLNSRFCMEIIGCKNGNLEYIDMIIYD